MAFVVATWTSALAGGIGGTTAMLGRLYRHVSFERDIHNQPIRPYLLKPVVGVVAGIIVLYVVAIPGAFLIYFAVNRELVVQEILTTSTFVALQILLGWAAGFYQREGIEKIKSAARGDKVDFEIESFDKDSPFHYKDVVQYERNLRRWSYTWGLFIFFYGIAWLTGLAMALLLTREQVANLESSSYTVTTALILSAWPAAAAGAVGGVFSIFRYLYEHVSLKQDFHRQHLMSYLVEPVIGFVLGLVMFFLFASGYLTLTNDDGSQMTTAPTAVLTLQLLLGWIAGFRQQTVTDFVQRLIRGLIAFFKRVIRLLLNPKAWFKKVEREKMLTEIAEERSVFSSLGPEDTPSGQVWR
jgi:hypothetical protein